MKIDLSLLLSRHGTTHEAFVRYILEGCLDEMYKIPADCQTTDTFFTGSISQKPKMFVKGSGFKEVLLPLGR